MREPFFLGMAFAGRLVLVDDSDPDHIVISTAVAIPKREAWLYKNKVALDRVRAGLEKARKGEFSKSPPNLDADSALADAIES